MYLLDTNIWLERLLNQERSEEVQQLLNQVSSDQLLITDFSFHSIGLILHRLDERRTFLRFVDDLFINGAVGLLVLSPVDMERVVAIADEYRLDFDDAYQYVAAEQHDVWLVSFDSDFDHTERGKMTPLDVIETKGVGNNDAL